MTLQTASRSPTESVAAVHATQTKLRKDSDDAKTMLRRAMRGESLEPAEWAGEFASTTSVPAGRAVSPPDGARSRSQAVADKAVQHALRTAGTSRLAADPQVASGAREILMRLAGRREKGGLAVAQVRTNALLRTPDAHVGRRRFAEQYVLAQMSGERESESRRKFG